MHPILSQSISRPDDIAESEMTNTARTRTLTSNTTRTERLSPGFVNDLVYLNFGERQGPRSARTDFRQSARQHGARKLRHQPRLVLW